MPLDREELEEAAVAARDFARVTKVQYEAFTEVGFTDEQALILMMHWMSTLMTQNNSD